MTRPPQPVRRPGRFVRAATVAACALGVAVASAGSADAATRRETPNQRADRQVSANLWEWNWPSVAKECRTQLGPNGFRGVQVAPPQDSVKRQHLGDGQDSILHPWWEVYQAVDYRLTSRMGSEQQFRSMVRTCRKAGVKVYVDAVINHMTGQGDTSYGGVSYERYRYPGLYAPRNFHKYSGDCPSASGGIEDFNNQQQVFNCELVGLADLRTDTGAVRTRLARYLNKLLRYGVSGFRVDAAKHIGQRDLDAIYSRLHDTVDGTRPYWALEVFGGGPGTLSPEAFTRSGDVLGLDGVKQLKSAFKSYNADSTGSIATLKDFGAGSGLTRGSNTLSFVQNHDTERNGDALSYKDGATNILANQYLLASGYGRTQVYSAFRWTNADDSPPATADGMITHTDCGAGWECVDRDKGVQAMVRWHNHVGRATRAHWWDDGANVISFSRGSRGWVALNNGTADKRISVATGMARGSYCDAITGGKLRGRCAGTVVKVGPRGRATVTVPAKGVVAVDRTTRR